MVRRAPVGETDDRPLLRAVARPDLELDARAVHSVLEGSPVGLVVVEDGQVVYASRRAVELTGLDISTRFCDAFAAIVHPIDAEKAAALVAAIASRRPHMVQIRTTPSTGGRTLDLRCFGSESRTLVAIGDASVEAERIRELAQFRAVADATSDLIGMANLDGGLLYVNPAARRFHGLSADTPLTEIPAFLGIPPEHIDVLMREGWPVLLRGEVWEGELDVVSSVTGERVPFWAVWVPTTDELGSVSMISSTFRDLSERRRFEQRLAFAASHDPLTGLPNRERLFEVLAEIAAARRPIAVLFCDLDNFKIVNDTLGHGVGDRVLRTIADRLVAVSRSNDVVGRLGGDEFLVVCEGIHNINQVFDIAERISEAIHEPIMIGDREYRMSASIGISLRHGDATAKASDLVLEADIAMYRAKEAGRRHIEVFDTMMRTRMAEQLDLERDLRHAISSGQIEVHFQPIVDILTRRIDGFEALVRWRHPDRGLLPPAVFLDLAETSGLGVELGDEILAQACAAAARFRAIDPNVQTGFNVSTSQMRASDLPERVERAALRAGTDLDHLVLEVTEEIVMTDADGARNTLHRIREMGVRIAVDDFGTGYSSLSMLRRLPVDILKVDRSFVDGLGIEPGDTQIVRLVLSLAEELGLNVVGEGVETEAQSTELARLGTRLAQGYLFAPPVGVDDAVERLRAANG